LALDNSAAIERRGDILTGQLQIATARLTVPAGYDNTPTARLVYIPGGCRIIQQLCTAVAEDGGQVGATVFLGDSSNVIIAGFGNDTPPEELADLTTASGTWVNVTFDSPSGLGDGESFEFNIVYASAK
jgi:hypothetical protein